MLWFYILYVLVLGGTSYGVVLYTQVPLQDYILEKVKLTHIPTETTSSKKVIVLLLYT